MVGFSNLSSEHVRSSANDIPLVWITEDTASTCMNWNMLTVALSSGSPRFLQRLVTASKFTRSNLILYLPGRFSEQLEEKSRLLIHYIMSTKLLASSLRTIYSINKPKFELLPLRRLGWEQHVVVKIDSVSNNLKWVDSIPTHVQLHGWRQGTQEGISLHLIQATPVYQ